jgi:arginine decarboxylase
MDDDDDDDDDDAEGGLQKSCAGQEGDREGRKRKKCCWPPEGYMDDLGDALDQALELMQSSSPSSLLLASLDAARWQFGCELGGGRKAMEESVDSAMRVRAKLASVPGLSILTEPCPRDQDKGYIGVDPLRISVNTAKICTGFEAADAMENGYGVYCEV